VQLTNATIHNIGMMKMMGTKSTQRLAHQDPSNPQGTTPGRPPPNKRRIMPPVDLVRCRGVPVHGSPAHDSAVGPRRVRVLAVGRCAAWRRSHSRRRECAPPAARSAGTGIEATACGSSSVPGLKKPSRAAYSSHHRRRFLRPRARRAPRRSPSASLPAGLATRRFQHARTVHCAGSSAVGVGADRDQRKVALVRSAGSSPTRSGGRSDRT